MAAANSTVALNSTADGATVSPLPEPSSTVLDFLQNKDFMMLELKLLCGAMGIIYLGAHASLRRPPSARASNKSKNDKAGKKRDEDEPFAQGLELMDAIMFPFMAAVMLVGLYYLIQWLKDPAILNKILRYYMSTMSTASLVTIYSHGLDLSASLIFPKYWRGADGALRKVDQKRRSVTVCDDVGNTLAEQPSSSLSSPLPGFLSLLAPSEKLRTAAWDARDLLTRHWVLKFYMHGMGQETVHVKFAHMMALLMSLATALVYFATSWSSFSNMLGYGMCYCSFLILSPTDFLTGSLVLGGLFFYDIFMVFYTPYMVTVATTLDVPIKLTFEAADKKSFLGLGDIVVPGILIGWALRLDLWIHYLNKIKREPVEISVAETDSGSGQAIEKTQVKHMEVKAPYINAKGNWGERLWTSRGRSQELPADMAASRFSKTYFHAAMAGYGAGMLVTLAMLMVFKRGQPALLYLVPGVLGSLLLTALVRGEFKKLWTYTEDGSLDVVDVVVEMDEQGNVAKTLGRLKDGKIQLIKDEEPKKDEEKKKKKKTDAKDEKEKKDGERHAEKGHRVFFLSLEVPSDEGDEENES